MHPLCTKDRNVSCGLGRNVEPLAILLPFYVRQRSLLKVEFVFQKGQLEDFDFHVIAWNKPTERDDRDWRIEEMYHAGTVLLPFCHPLPLSLITTMISFHLSTKKKLCVIICSLCHKTHCNIDN